MIKEIDSYLPPHTFPNCRIQSILHDCWAFIYKAWLRPSSSGHPSFKNTSLPYKTWWRLKWSQFHHPYHEPHMAEITPCFRTTTTTRAVSEDTYPSSSGPMWVSGRRDRVRLKKRNSHPNIDPDEKVIHLFLFVASYSIPRTFLWFPPPQAHSLFSSQETILHRHPSV